jgi:hypothetical protein
MRVPLLSLVVLAAVPAAAAEISVKAANGHVDVTATTAPLAEILDRISRQTGMKIVYEGAPPRQLMTVSLLGRTPAEAVNALLEGQGLNYALIADATGTSVQTLLMTGSSTAKSTGMGGAGGMSPARATMVAPPLSGSDAADEPEEDGEQETVQPEAAAAAGEPAPAPGADATAPAHPGPGVFPPGMSPAPNANGAAPPSANPGVAPLTPSAAAPGSLNPAQGSPAPGVFPNPNANVPGLRLPPQPGMGGPRMMPVSPYSPVAPFVPAMPGGTPPLPGGAPTPTNPPGDDAPGPTPTGPPDAS